MPELSIFTQCQVLTTVWNDGFFALFSHLRGTGGYGKIPHLQAGTYHYPEHLLSSNPALGSIEARGILALGELRSEVRGQQEIGWRVRGVASNVEALR